MLPLHALHKGGIFKHISCIQQDPLVPGRGRLNCMRHCGLALEWGGRGVGHTQYNNIDDEKWLSHSLTDLS